MNQESLRYWAGIGVILTVFMVASIGMIIYREFVRLEKPSPAGSMDCIVSENNQFTIVITCDRE